ATFTLAENVKKMYKDTIPIINIDTRQVLSGVGNVLLGVIDIIKKITIQMILLNYHRKLFKIHLTILLWQT
ncbi:MAG: hypothetical protein U9R41_03430, partial [Candidatus Marinimicrobia bacterium]|nr:hypothetical protein [Candidatus Neomarinimicrobiota bacterium]